MMNAMYDNNKNRTNLLHYQC